MLEFLSDSIGGDVLADVALVNVATGAIMDLIPKSEPPKKPGKHDPPEDQVAYQQALRKHRQKTKARASLGAGIGAVVAALGALALGHLGPEGKEAFAIGALAAWLAKGGHVTADSVLRLLGLKAKDPDPEASRLDLPGV